MLLTWCHDEMWLSWLHLTSCYLSRKNKQTNKWTESRKEWMFVQLWSCFLLRRMCFSAGWVIRNAKTRLATEFPLWSTYLTASLSPAVFSPVPPHKQPTAPPSWQDVYVVVFYAVCLFQLLHSNSCDLSLLILTYALTLMSINKFKTSPQSSHKEKTVVKWCRAEPVWIYRGRRRSNMIRFVGAWLYFLFSVTMFFYNYFNLFCKKHFIWF